MSNELTQAQIKFLNDYTKGTWTYKTATGLVDVDGDFDCCGSNLKDDLRNAGGETTLKNFMGVRFGKVSGDFDCSENYLTSLEGAPQEVGGYFNCSISFLTSLEGAPQKVGGDFFCGWNNLTNLKGAPQKVGGGFGCEGDLSSLDGVPQEIGGWFSCEEFYLDEGQWNLEGWLSAWEEGPKAQKLILTILPPELTPTSKNLP